MQVQYIIFESRYYVRIWIMSFFNILIGFSSKIIINEPKSVTSPTTTQALEK